MSQYIGENNAFAAINGSYFCPADYSSCAGIAGSFYWMWYDTNSGNFANPYQNQFNHGPVIAFDYNNNVHYFRNVWDWPGKEEFEAREHVSLQAAISNGPGLIFEGEFVVSESDLDNKQRTVKHHQRVEHAENQRLLDAVVIRAATRKTQPHKCYEGKPAEGEPKWKGKRPWLGPAQTVPHGPHQGKKHYRYIVRKPGHKTWSQRPKIRLHDRYTEEEGESQHRAY